MHHDCFTPKNTPDEILNMWKMRPSLTNKIARGKSAHALMHSWAHAQGFPCEVKKALDQSGHSALQNLQFKFGCPEYRVKLDGRGGDSVNDIYAVAKSDDGPVCCIVDGKVKERFDDTVAKWLTKHPGENADDRLKDLQKTLGLLQQNVSHIRYQLLHRTASALIKARKNSDCKNAVMLVHSFQPAPATSFGPEPNFDAFANFAKAMGVSNVTKNCILHAKKIDGINLYLGWITGDQKYLTI